MAREKSYAILNFMQTVLFRLSASGTLLRVMMALWKLCATFFGCSVLCAQSNPAPPPTDRTNPPSVQATQPPDKPVADQTTPALPDSTKLEPIKTVKAVYPYEARDKQLQGEVWLKILISETGDVENVEVISGEPILARSAVEAVGKWKFKPFIKNGKPVKVSSRLPFDFAFSDKIKDEKVPNDASEVTPSAVGDSPIGNAEAPKRVRVSQGVSQGLLIHRVQPVYPPEAESAGIQGTVVLHARISKEGRIVDLKLVSGPKELAPAAMGAVQQWRYRPYLLLGSRWK